MNQLKLKIPHQPLPRAGAWASPAPLAHKRETWLAIHFPELCLAAHQSPEGQPFVVLERQRGLNRVYRANAAAQAQGIVPTMPLNAAYALCQTLQSCSRDEKLEATQLQHLAQVTANFSPRLVLAKPDVVLLEIGASLRLFGGLKQLHAQLAGALENIPQVMSCAPVADAAELMARNGIAGVIPDNGRLPSALGAIELQGLPLEDALRQQLQRCGIQALRDLWRLPRPDLARRFGPELVHYLERLSGQRILPREPFFLPLDFSARHEFEQETEDREQLLHAARLLLERAGYFLRARVLLSESICFTLIYSPRSSPSATCLRLQVRAQQGGDSPEHFLPQLEEQLQQQALEAPLTALQLAIAQFKPRQDNNAELFSRDTGQGGQDHWPVLLDLLLARLGRKRIYRLRMVADYRPEHAWCRDSAALTRVGRRAGNSSPQVALPTRPTWLLPQPRKCCPHQVQLVSGAERLESGWWDGQDQRREYYRGITASGRRCWLYRDLRELNQHWYLHGLFA